MNIALISDTHCGVRNDSQIMFDSFSRFLKGCFFPVIDERKIKTIIHLGDLFDRRKYINIYTAHRTRQDFIQPIIDRKIDFHVIAGNHDVYLRNTNDISSLNEFLRNDVENSSVHVYTSPKEINIANLKILMLPWITKDNEAESFRIIKNTDARVIMAHLELLGFEMHKGSYSEHGHDAKLFRKFDLVCSGHFHHKSTYENINYLGSPYEMTWSDYGDTKGFHILNTDTLELEFIPNSYKLFHKVIYDDENKEYEDVINIDYSKYANCYTKVIVKNKTNHFWYDQFITKLEEAGVSHIQAVDDHLNLAIEEDDLVNQAESTLEILQKSIKSSGLRPDLEKSLDTLLRDLYFEASIIQS